MLSFIDRRADTAPHIIRQPAVNILHDPPYEFPGIILGFFGDLILEHQ